MSLNFTSSSLENNINTPKFYEDLDFHTSYAFEMYIYDPWDMM